MPTIDLRSDTVTQPSLEMRRVMAEAVVGDDVYEEDPTVRTLQDRTADLLGHEAGLFVPSGSMSNLIALMLHAGHGGEVLAHEDSHIIHYEVASGAAVAGCQIVPVAGERGILTPEALAPKVRAPLYYNARTRLVELENTGNLAGGTCYTPDQTRAVTDWAHSRQIPVHLDGARLWNASAALGRPVDEFSRDVDSVTVCFSKGLGAPVGSVLCGKKAWVDEAKRLRKVLGGGMRQSGILAAAALFALDHHREGLVLDHEHCQALAQAIGDSAWARVVRPPETNILYVDVLSHNAEHWIGRLADQGVRCGASGEQTIRLVTHRDVGREQILRACEVIRRLS